MRWLLLTVVLAAGCTELGDRELFPKSDAVPADASTAVDGARAVDAPDAGPADAR